MLRDCTPLHVWQSKLRPPTQQLAKLDLLLQEAALDISVGHRGSRGWRWEQLWQKPCCRRKCGCV